MKGELPGPAELPPPQTIDANVAYASQVVAKSIAAKAIVIHTTTGGTARRVACYRPNIPILALTSHPEIRRRLALTWGVESDLVENIRNTPHMVGLAFEQVLSRGVAAPGDTIVITAGTPYGVAGRTNMLKVEEIPAHVADAEDNDD
jgi:pyruvate kinase